MDAWAGREPRPAPRSRRASQCRACARKEFLHRNALQRRRFSGWRPQNVVQRRRFSARSSRAISSRSLLHLGHLVLLSTAHSCLMSFAHNRACPVHSVARNAKGTINWMMLGSCTRMSAHEWGGTRGGQKHTEYCHNVLASDVQSRQLHSWLWTSIPAD